MNTVIAIIVLSAKKPIDTDYSALTEKLNRVIKLLNLKLEIELGLLNRRIFTPKIGREKYLLLILH